MYTRVQKKLLSTVAAAAFFVCGMPSITLGAEVKEFSGEQWITLQLRSSVRLDKTVDSAKDSLLALFARADIDGGGVSETDYEIHQQLQDAATRSQRMTKWWRRDLDGDGVITSVELEKSLGKDARIPIRRGGIVVLPTEDQVAATLKKLVERELKADRDGDMKIDLSEIMADVKRVGTSQRSRRSRTQLIPMTLDSNGDGVVKREELEAAANRVLGEIDRDGNGRFSIDEVDKYQGLVSSLSKVRNRIRSLQKSADRYRHKAKTCAFPKAKQTDRIVVVRTQTGKALSSVGLDGDEAAVTVANVWIEKGEEPLYLILSSGGAMIWQLSGAVERLSHVIGSQTRGRDESVSRVGIKGVPEDKIYIAPVRNCIDSVRMTRSHRHRIKTGNVYHLVGRSADSEFAKPRLSAVSVPTGTVDKTIAYKNTLPPPKDEQAKAVWDEALKSHPGGVVKIDAEDVISRVKAASYVVLPKGAGISQLLDSGALQVLETRTVMSVMGVKIVGAGANDSVKLPGGVRPEIREVPHKFRITRKMRYPAGLKFYTAVPFVLGRGVPKPEGNPGRSCLVSEETGQLITGTASNCR